MARKFIIKFFAASSIYSFEKNCLIGKFEDLQLENSKKYEILEKVKKCKKNHDLKILLLLIINY